MNVKDALCRAFCDSVQVNEVPDGLAIGTPFARNDGDLVGFFLIRGGDGLVRIEDDGMTLPALVATGLDLSKGARAQELEDMLKLAGANYDPASCGLYTPWMNEADIAGAALRFTSLMLRINDLQLLHPYKVANTFYEDVMRDIERRFAGKVKVTEKSPILADLPDFVADAVITGPGCPPLAVFIAVSDARVYDAVMGRTLARHVHQQNVRVAAILEQERGARLSLKAQQQARNYLDASPSFRAAGAMTLLEEMVFGSTQQAVH